MILASGDPTVSGNSIGGSIVILGLVVAVVAYGLWAWTRDPRVQRNTRRDEIIVGLGLSAVGFSIAAVTGFEVSWQLGDPVVIGRVGHVAAPAFVPVAIGAAGGLAALVGVVVAPAVRRHRGVTEPVIRPSRRVRRER